MELTLSVPFGYEPNDEVRGLLVDFRDMVNFCIRKALEHNVTGFASLRRLVYEEWKERWDYSTHYCHSACRVATSMLKSFRRLKRKGLAKSDRPEARKLFMQLDPVLVRFEGDRLRISVKPRKFLYIQLKFGDYQRKFIEEWRSGKLRVGEISINENKVLVPFRKDVDLSNPDDWIAIDINESNVTVVSTNPHITQFKTNLREIRSAYFEKRQRIQKLSKYKPITSKRLMAKYSKREKNRVKDLCHKVSRKIVEFAREGGFGVIVEDLKFMRRRIRCTKEMNRRIHSLPFRRLQFYIEYKAKLNGLPVEYVSAKFSSSLCPRCGGKLASNGYRLLKCNSCEYENDRDIIACLNLLKRNPRCGESPLPPKATDEFKEVERIVIKS
ncbi:MAG: transposase [Candidatus Bathyarchaeia archaeon]